MLRHTVVAYLLNVVYCIALIFQLPWYIWCYIVQNKYRRTLNVRLLGQVEWRRGSGKCVWFEAASLGEVRALEPLLRAFQHQYPQWQCVISSSTSSGLALARQLFPEIYVFPLPIDFSWAVKTAITRLRPDLLVLVDIVPWQNLIGTAKRFGTSVAVVNGRMSKRDYRWHLRVKWLFTRALYQVDLITAQSSEYADRFVRLGAVKERVKVVGSLKFDGVKINRDNAVTHRFSRMAGISQDDIVFMAGSTHAGEEKVAFSVYQKLAVRYPELRLVIAPRHLNRFRSVARMLEHSDHHWQRFTQLEQNGRDPAARILLIDTLGDVAWWWGISHIAFVGGSLFGGRGKNMLEPAAYGAAVCFGPNTSDFHSVVQNLLLHQAAVIVRNEFELTAFAEHCLREVNFRKGLGMQAEKFVKSRCGVTQDTLCHLASMVTCHHPVSATLPYQSTQIKTCPGEPDELVQSAPCSSPQFSHHS